MPSLLQLRPKMQRPPPPPPQQRPRLPGGQMPLRPLQVRPRARRPVRARCSQPPFTTHSPCSFGTAGLLSRCACRPQGFGESRNAAVWEALRATITSRSASNSGLADRRSQCTPCGPLPTVSGRSPSTGPTACEAWRKLSSWTSAWLGIGRWR